MIARLIAVQEWSRPSERQIMLTKFSWPVEAFGTEDEIVGYSMPKAPDDAYFQLTAAGKTTRQLLQMKYLMNASYWTGKSVTSTKPELSEQDRIEVSIDLHDAIGVINTQGLVYSDFSGNNLVVRRGEFPSIFILDADSIATPEIRIKNPVKSPMWDTPSGLDPVESDRSLFALWCWRFLLEEYSSYPSSEGSSKFQHLDSRSMADTLVFTFETGNEHAFASLSTELRSLRNDARDSRAIQRAAKTRFARLVVKEALESRTAEDQAVVDKAVAHLARERLIEDSNPSRQQLLLTRQSRESGLFVLDLPPSITRSSPPSTIKGFQQMLLDAREAEIALFLANGEAKQFESHPFTLRAVRHALKEVGVCSVSSRAAIGVGTFDWTWPNATYVNHALIAIETPNGKTLTDNVSRSFNEDTTQRQVTLPRGGNVKVRITLGVETPAGSVFLSEDSAEHVVAILPQPPAPQIKRTRQASFDSLSQDDGALLDPQAVQAAILEERRKRRRARQQLAISGFASAVLVGVAVWLLNPFKTNLPVDKCLTPGITEIGTCSYETTSKITSLDFFHFRNGS